MSIEALIQAHTEALLANTEAVKLLTLSLAGRTPAKEEKSKSSKIVQTELTKDAKPEVEASDVKKEKPKVKPKPEIEEQEYYGDEPISYETVRSLVLKLAGAGKREEIKALNAKHGIANLKVLLDKEDDFSTVNDQVKLEAVYADLQALEG